MAILSAHRCDIGQKRRQNQDYVWVDESIGLFILADGMGGYEAGDLASKLAVHTVGQEITNRLKLESPPFSASQIKTIFNAAIEKTNAVILQASCDAGQKRRMGTTLVILFVQAANAYISHVGDSRMYLIRNNTITQLTEDHSWSAEIAKRLAKNKAQSGSAPPQVPLNILTQAIGQETLPKASFLKETIVPDDWLLLCSDGLWNMIDNDQILEAFQQVGQNPSQVAEALINAANKAGGKDNISVIAVKINAPLS